MKTSRTETHVSEDDGSCDHYLIPSRQCRLVLRYNRGLPDQDNDAVYGEYLSSPRRRLEEEVEMEIGQAVAPWEHRHRRRLVTTVIFSNACPNNTQSYPAYSVFAESRTLINEVLSLRRINRLQDTMPPPQAVHCPGRVFPSLPDPPALSVLGT